MELITCNKGEDLTVVFSRNQEVVKNGIYEAVKDGIENNKVEVSAFEIQFNGEDEIYKFDIKEGEYVDNLLNCLKYFESEQDFEKCGDIISLINQVKEK